MPRLAGSGHAHVEDRRPATLAGRPHPASIASRTSSTVWPSSTASSSTVGGRPSCVTRRSVAGATADVEILEAARDVHRPGRVAEVTLQLTEHGRDGEGGEGPTPLRLVALHRLEHPKLGHLDQVVKRFTTVLEPPSAVHGEPPVRLDQLVANCPVTVAPVALEEALEHLFVTRRHPRPRAAPPTLGCRAPPSSRRGSHQ